MPFVHGSEGTPAVELLIREPATYRIADFFHGFAGGLHHGRGTEQYGNAFLENVEADRFRVTWIDTDGTVLFDTQVDQSVMDNHADREEIREAFATG